ncbi:MAG: HPF/RaiA family ribosome-associated protein [Acidobacteriota bacterium]
MKIHVRTQQDGVGPAARAYVDRRLEFSLGRFASRVPRVSVQIVDLNGPRGGEDISCRIELWLPPAGRLFVEATDANPYAAIDRAADRAARAVARVIGRSRDVARDSAPARRHLPASPYPEVREQPGA